MPQGFRVAQGFVEVSVEINEADARAAGQRASQQVADEFSKGDAWDKAGKKAGDQAGTAFTASAKTKLEAAFKDFMDDFERAGGDGGKRSGRKSYESWLATFGAGLPFGIGKVISTVFKGTEGLFTKLGGDAAVGWEGGFRGLFAGMSQNLAGDFTDLFSPQGVVGLAIIGALGATLLFGLAGPVGSIIAGALGAGLLGAGIAASFQSPLVKSSAKQLGSDLKDTLSQATSSFVGETRVALDHFDAFVKREGPALAKVFDPLSKFVGGMELSIEGFVNKLLPGLSTASKNLGPVVGVLEELGPRFGAGIGDFLSKVVGNGNRAAAELNLVATAVLNIIRVTGDVINIGEHFFAMWIEGMAGLARGVAFLTGWIPGFGSKAKSAADSLGEFAREANGSSGSLNTLAQGFNQAGQAATYVEPSFDDLARQLSQTANNADTLSGAIADRLFGDLMAMDQAVLGVAEAHTRLTQALQDNGRQLDINKAQGQANREAILAVVQANIAEYDAMIRTGSSAQAAAAAYDQNTQALVRQLQQAGFTQAQIDGLIGTYRNVPDTVNTNVALFGLTQAINDLADLERQIHNIPSTKTVTVTTEYKVAGGPGSSTYNQQVPRAARARGGIDSYASGGTPAGIYSSPRGLVKYAEPETGGEAYIPRNIPARQAAPLLQTAAAWHGMAVVSQPAPAAATGGAGATRSFGPYNINVGGETLVSLVIDAITGNPTIVAASADEGRRRRAALVGA